MAKTKTSAKSGRRGPPGSKTSRTRATTASDPRGPGASAGVAWEKVTSLEALVALLGEATEAEVRELVEGTSPKDLIDLGRRVATPRIDDDALRILVSASRFFASASAALRATLRLSPKVLRVAAWSALQGYHAFRGHSASAAELKVMTSANEAGAREVLASVRALRDQLATALRGVAAEEPVLLDRISSASRPGAAGQPESTPDVALRELAALGRELLASTDAGIAKRLGHYQVDAPWLTAIEQSANTTGALLRSAKAPKIAPASQADIDRWDGINLLLLERIVQSFLAAHGVNAEVPRLGYVSLRGALGGHRGASTEGAPVTPAPAPPR